MLTKPMPIRPAWKDLPSDDSGTMERIVAFLQLADGEALDFATLVQQCTNGRQYQLAATALNIAVRRGLIVEVGIGGQWRAVIR